VVRKALYGRMRLGRCVRRDYGRPHCYDFLLVFCSWSNLGPLWNRLGAISSAIRQKRDLKEDEERSVVVAFGAALATQLAQVGSSARLRSSGARFTKYLTTILRLSYDNAKVTIDLR